MLSGLGPLSMLAGEEEEGRQEGRAGLRSREEGADDGGEEGGIGRCKARNDPPAEARTDHGANDHLRGEATLRFGGTLDLGNGWKQRKHLIRCEMKRFWAESPSPQ